MSRAVDLHNELQFTLPPSLIGRMDISRLLREIEKVDYQLEAQAIQHPDQAVTIPSMSRVLAETAGVNELNVADRESRKFLISALRQIKDKAPNVHITFAVDAEPDYVSQIVGWLRQQLHPTALVTVGLQPSIVGGCIVRTPDHIYDFSLRKQFKQQLPSLVEDIRAASRIV